MIPTEKQHRQHIKSVQKYNKTHYSRFETFIKPKLRNRIDNYCEHYEISKADFLQKAIEELD